MPKPPLISAALQVTVHTANGAPLSKARVWLQQPQTNTASGGVTDASGHVSLAYKPGAIVAGLPNPAFPITLGVTAYRASNFTLTVSGAGPVTMTLPAGFTPLIEPDKAAPPTTSAANVATGALLYTEAVAGSGDLCEPGYAFFVRRNGLPFADACRGLARVLTPTIAEQAMTPDTIIHLASMSKSITSTALVAMKEDWQAIADLVAQLKAGQSVPHTTYSLQIPFNPGHPPPPPAPFDFPDVLAPLLVDRSFRSEMQSAGALNGMPFSVTAVFRRFDLVGPFTLSPTPAIMPWHAGLLRQVLTGVPVIDYDQKFLPLFKHDIDIDHEVGNGVFDITIRQLLNHKTYLFGIHDALHSADEQAAYANHQPALTGLPGPGVPTPIATIDNRAQVKALLREGGGPFPAGSYQNWNYSVVGRIIEICTGMNLDDYQNARLLADPRFANIRRHVVDPAAACLYYGGPGPAFTGGVTFPDFSQWGGAGGFYGPASQLTDWLYALAARQPVSGLNGVAPLVSAAGIDALFKGGMFFSGGGARPIPGGRSVGYEKNGGTGLSDPATGKGGAANGKFGVYFGPGSAIYTVFFGANADHPADRPYDDAVFLLCSSSFWT